MREAKQRNKQTGHWGSQRQKARRLPKPSKYPNWGGGGGEKANKKKKKMMVVSNL